MFGGHSKVQPCWFDQFDPQQQLKTFKRIKYEVPIITGWWFFATPLKNDGVKVSWDDDIPNVWKHKTCSKPPTRK